MTARERLFGWQHAFDHPVSIWVTVAVVSMLVAAPLALLALSAAGRPSAETRSAAWRRYVSWLVLAPVMCGAVLLGAAWLIGATALLSLLCYREFARATGLFRERLVSALVVIGILLVTFAVIDHWYGLFVALFPLMTVLIAGAVIVEDRPRGYIQRTALGIFAFAFFGSCYGHLGYMANADAYRPLVLTLLLAVGLNDILPELCRGLPGRRPLAPVTSPDRTWTGTIVSVVVITSLVAFLGHHLFRGTPLDDWLHLTALGLLVSIGGQFGDLMLASIKRDLGIPGFAPTIPGHGGLLDRLDGLVLVAPAAFHYVNHFHAAGPIESARIITGAQ